MSVQIDLSRDKLFDELGLMRLRESYMRPDEKSPQERLKFVAEAFASNPEHAQRIYDYASQHWLSFATPILAFGRTKKGLPVSCFLSYMEDSAEGLVNTLSEVNWLSMLGGGVGIHVEIRSADEKSVGVMPHLKVYDAACLAYRQGSTRRGSYAAFLSIDHPDIIPFIEMRKPTGAGKSTPSRNDVHDYMTYGTSRANAYRILEDTLNLRDIRIYDTVEDADGKQKRVLNKKETTLAQQKQQAIKDAFQNWVWKDPYRRAELVEKYNELFNSTRPREYDGSHIRFGGMNPEIRLREHQQNAIAHVLYGGNTLLAHEVGAGKTFEMAASAMEAKRLGLCQKSMFVVPNHLTLQWANEFLRLYPSAKLLVASKKDFETARRKKFCARIATGDYDAVIIGHSQFEKIPVSAERQERILTAQIDEIENAIAEMKSQNGERFSIKQMEKTRKGLEARLEKLRATDRKDDVITFEQLGVDRLFVDEAHAFKNLFLYTKMRNVAGLSTSEAQKSSDMFMKCQYMDELTGGRGIIFATGTPVSNSMTIIRCV